MGVARRDGAKGNGRGDACRVERAVGNSACGLMTAPALALVRSLVRSLARPPVRPAAAAVSSIRASPPPPPHELSLSIYLSMYLTRSPRVELPAPHAKTFTHARPARGVYPNLRGLGRNLSRVRIDLLTTFYDNSNNQRYAPRICMVSGHEVLKFDLSLI